MSQNSNLQIDFDQVLKEVQIDVSSASAATTGAIGSSSINSSSSSDVALTFQDFHLPQVEGGNVDESDFDRLLLPDGRRGKKSSSSSSSSSQQPFSQSAQQSSASASSNSESRFWRIEFYRAYFDVDSQDVLSRVWQSIWPFSSGFSKFERDNPDLYGPFWISTTLIILVAIMSNLVSFINHSNNLSSQNPVSELRMQEWTYDFRAVTVGASVMYSFAMVVPALLWMMMRHKGVAISLVESIYLYGYSFSILIPVSIICVLPIGLVQWPAVLIGFAISGLFIIANMFPMWKQASRPFIPIFVSFVVVLHLLLMAIFKFYFF